VPKSKKSRSVDRWVQRNQGKHPCWCGCGDFIYITREHHKKSVGVPKFIKGHNLQQGAVEATPPPAPEKESAWDKLSSEEQQRRLGHLKSFGAGEENPAWKGGRRLDDAGYYQILCPEHPFAKGGYMAEHRLLVEERTRTYYPDSPHLIEINGEKYLRSDTVVHHIDEDKTHNDPGKGPGDEGNLMLLEKQAAHAFIHRSPLPMEERLHRISLGIYHSGPLNTSEEDIDADN